MTTALLRLNGFLAEQPLALCAIVPVAPAPVHAPLAPFPVFFQFALVFHVV
jgi:hypothetical protein